MEFETFFINFLFIFMVEVISPSVGVKVVNDKIFNSDYNDFKEEGMIRPLPSGHIYSHFEFTTFWSNPSIRNSIKNYRDYDLIHYDLFPRSLGEVIEKYHVRELHLSLTQGLWRHQKWGYPITEAPPGAQLWVWFNPSADDLDQTWRDLVNALSGLFCASLNFIDSTNTASPEISFRPMGLAEEWYSNNSSYMRYAALPRENVCTENLTPWKKLLPCDTKGGLSTLLHPTPLYSAHYHSLALHLRPSCQDEECLQPKLELVQSLSLVQKIMHEMEGRQDWTLRKLFSSMLISVCPLASDSTLMVDMSENKNESIFKLNPKPSSVLSHGSGTSARSYAVYNLLDFVSQDALNLQARYTAKHIHGIIPPPPLKVLRYITGHGQEGGSITVKLYNSSNKPLSVVYFELLPWYLRLFFHSSHESKLRESLYVSKLVPARDRERGWLYEVVVQVQPKSTVELRLEFHRALLKWLEYPPDANHGFYLPAAIFSTILPDAKNISVNRIEASGLMNKLLLSDAPSFIRIPTETLLVTLPTPDFSMPYNVICLACTVVALAFGPIHNITTKRLTVKKLQPKSFPGAKVFHWLKAKLTKDKKTPAEAPQTLETQPVNNEIIVEENPAYCEDIKNKKLADIPEVDEETVRHRI